MRRIKVVFSIGGMHGGGSERQMVSLLRHLNRDRIEPILYLVYRIGPLLEEIPDDVPVVAFEERYQGSQWPGLLMHRRRVRDMSRFLREVQADVSYDRTFLMTLIAADAAQRAGIPNVSTIVTDPPIGFWTVAGRFGNVKRRILRRLYTDSTTVLANSEGAARSAERFYGLEPRLVQTHYNGVDLDRIHAASVIMPADPWWTATEANIFRIVTAGRLNEKKGFHLLVDAVAQLRTTYPDTTIRLAVLGEGPARPELAAQIERLGLRESVKLVGFQKNAAAWYKSADLFVLPSFLEGMPNVILEAMACETPVLSTDCPSGPREILGDSKFGELCEMGSVTALHAGIGRFIQDRNYGSRYTSAALERIHNTFSSHHAAAKLEEHLIAAAQPSPASPSGSPGQRSTHS